LKQKRVLIVEDNKRNLKLFEIIMRNFEIELFTTSNGLNALEIIQKEHLDLVLMDIQMPGMSGLEIIERIRNDEKFKDLKIIAVTAYAMSGDREKLLECGFNEYVSKPIRIQEFKKTIQKFLNFE
jgi:two-component system, cell cycle response regulator DivK